MNPKTPWLDDVVRQLQISLLLRRLNLEYFLPGNDAAAAVDRRPRSPLDEAISHFLKSRPLVKQTVEAAEKATASRPPKRLPPADRLAGLGDRVRYEVAVLIKNSGVKSGIETRRAVEENLLKAVEKTEAKDYRAIPEEERHNSEAILANYTAGLDQRENVAGMVEVWIELAQGVRAWKQFRRHLETSIDSAYANRIRQEIERLTADKESFEKWRDDWMFQGENGAAPRTVLASVTRVFTQYSEAKVSEAFDQAAKVCERTQKLLSELSRFSAKACDDGRAESIQILTRAIDASLVDRATETRWPPAALAELFGEIADHVSLSNENWVLLASTKRDEKYLQRFPQAIPSLPVGEGEGFWARVLLLCKVVGWVDKLRLAETDWELIEPILRRFSRSLFPHEIEVSLFASHEAAPTGMQVSVEPAEPGERGRVDEIGLALRMEGDSWRALKKAKLIRPRPTPEFVRQLDHFRQWCEANQADQSFLQITSEIREDVQEYASLREWWSQSIEVGTSAGTPREKLWRLMERLQTAAAIAPSSPAAELLSYLHSEVEGFSWEESDVPVAEKEIRDVVARGGVVLTTLPLDATGGGARPATYRVRRLRLPDGSRIYPHVLLQAPRGWLKDRPLAARLAALEPLRLRTQFDIPDWTGWAEWNKLVADEVYESRDAAPKASAARALQAFRSTYLRGKDNDASAHAFRTLARELYECLTSELDYVIRPALDSNLTPVPIRVADADSMIIDWQLDSRSERRPTGTVIDVATFGDRREKPRVTATLDHQFPVDLVPWLSLPIPEAVGEETESFIAGVRRLPWAPNAAAVFGGLVTNLRDWAAKPDGEAWLTKELEATLGMGAKGDGDWTPWLKLLLNQKRLEVFPLVNFDEGSISWPTSVEVGSPGVQWKADDSVPHRRLICDAYFSSDRRRAGGVFSQGPVDERSPLTSLVRLSQEVAALPNGDLRTALEAVQHEASDVVDGGTPSESVLLAALDAFVADAQLPEAKAFTAFRDYCHKIGFEVLPRNWTPGIPTTLVPDEGLTGAPQFSDIASSGNLVVISSGLLRADGETVRAARTRLSAGTAPSGYKELLELLTEHKSPITETLAVAARKWPERKLKRLEKGEADPLQFTIARDFFPTLYKSFDEPSRQQYADLFAALTKLIKQMLKDELGLTTFEPKSIDEFPKEWIRFVNHTKYLSTRIKRVVCPGLCQGKQLFISAEVELE